MTRQSYAYGVSLVCVIAVLYALPNTIRALGDYRFPLAVPQAASDLDVTSFEKFRLDLQTKLSRDAFRQIEWDHLDKDGGWQLYTAARNARVAQVRAKAGVNALAYGILTSIA